MQTIQPGERVAVPLEGVVLRLPSDVWWTPVKVKPHEAVSVGVGVTKLTETDSRRPNITVTVEQSEEAGTLLRVQGAPGEAGGVIISYEYPKGFWTMKGFKVEIVGAGQA